MSCLQLQLKSIEMKWNERGFEMNVERLRGSPPRGSKNPGDWRWKRSVTRGTLRVQFKEAFKREPKSPHTQPKLCLWVLKIQISSIILDLFFTTFSMFLNSWRFAQKWTFQEAKRKIQKDPVTCKLANKIYFHFIFNDALFTLRKPSYLTVPFNFIFCLDVWGRG